MRFVEAPRRARADANHTGVASWTVTPGAAATADQGQRAPCAALRGGAGGAGRHQARPTARPPENAIERRLPAEQPRMLRAAEARVRSVLLGLVEQPREAGPPGAAP
jgi:hypothetical protein